MKPILTYLTPYLITSFFFYGLQLQSQNNFMLRHNVSSVLKLIFRIYRITISYVLTTLSFQVKILGSDVIQAVIGCNEKHKQQYILKY